MKGKVAVITGAAGGIGGEVAALFHAKGMLLVLADIDKKRLEAAARPYGEGALAVQCDITKPAEVKDLFRRAAKRFGGVDLGHQAGAQIEGFSKACDHGAAAPEILVMPKKHESRIRDSGHDIIGSIG